jgi:hypothetical protein
MFHTDIKAENVFVKRIRSGGYFEYAIGSKTYFVENTGYTIYLADFGVAVSMKRAYASLYGGYLGLRDAELINDSYWIPIKSNVDKPIGRTMLHKWDDGSYSSIARSEAGIGLEYKPVNTSRPIDLDDTNRFPPFDFFMDIQDVIRMFIGGKRTMQPDNHRGFGSTLNLEFADRLRSIAYAPGFQYKIRNSAKYIRADLMLDAIYTRDPAISAAIASGATRQVIDRFVVR